MKVNPCNKCLGDRVDYFYKEMPYSCNIDNGAEWPQYYRTYRTYLKCKSCGLTYAMQSSLRPTPYEVIVKKWNEINSPEIKPIEENCENCNCCVKINQNKVYAVCNETGKVFRLWQDDTRKNKCDFWAEKKI